MARIYCGWDAGYTAITSCNGLTSTNAQLFEEGCSFSSFTYTFTPLQGDPNFTCDVARTHSVQNWEPLGGIRWLVSGNTTNTTRVGRLDITYYDTEGNSYYESTTITQPSCSPTPSASNIYCGWASAWTPDTTCNGYSDYDAQLYVEGCTLDGFSYMFQIISGDSSFTCDVARTHNTQNWEPLGGIRARVSGNTTNETRVGYLYVTFRDTDQNLYNQRMIITQAPCGSGPTPDRWVYLNPSAATYAASVNGSKNFTVRASGCTIDSARTPVFTLSGDTSWFSIQQSRFNSSGYWQIYLNVSRNLTTSARDAYISVLGVYDTDGNRYDDLVFHATQNWGSYTFINYNPDNNMTSGGGIETVEAVGVNTTVCSISLTYSGTSTPEYWEGVEQPTCTALGNYLTINWPANPFNADRRFNFSTKTTWGDNCEHTSSLSTGKWQDAAVAPTQKDIEAAHTGFTVDSGNTHASTYVLTSGCTYDHFTYITGGSFSVTADTFPGDSILFSIPENPTNSARTGYVYFTFYDSDGNPYGPQTITFNQQAGSSPGPGPGPEPESGYVLTTLTISDQEQHRYFVEARPGVVYSAAGQYYKTVLACEARYSLYYVNSYGGVDVLPFKEKGWKKSDTVTRFNYSRSFRNNTLEFENVNYMNEIKASWELHTGWMSDESSQRMHELVESTIVYLYDAEEKTYTPVVMTDKKLEYKTYHNQGRKFYNYTVNVEESQSKERR